jgi:hypothetical protein
MNAATSIWHQAVDEIKSGAKVKALETTAYAQGMSQAQKDHSDGYRDAQRVLAGKQPIKALDAEVTPSYKTGWDKALEEALAVLGAEAI